MRVMFEIYMASVDCKHCFQKQTYAEYITIIPKEKNNEWMVTISMFTSIAKHLFQDEHFWSPSSFSCKSIANQWVSYTFHKGSHAPNPLQIETVAQTQDSSM
jgi:hypothetical protein